MESKLESKLENQMGTGLYNIVVYKGYVIQQPE